MSFPRYERYKDSGVDWLGKVPEHWPVFALKRIANLQSGDTIAPEAIEPVGEYPVYGGNGLRGFTTSFTHNGTYALIGRQGALCGNINYASGSFWASEHAIVVTPTSDVDTTWLGELLREMNLNQYSIASAQPGLSVDNIRKLLIAVPALAEQQAVGQFLRQETAKIDALIEEQRRLIELLKEKRQAVISHAVSLEPSRNRLRHHVLRIEQGWSPLAEDRDPEPEEWAVLKLSAVKRGDFDGSKVKALPSGTEIPYGLELKDGDLLVTRANTPELVGDSCYVHDSSPRVIFSDLIYRLVLDKQTMSGEFLNLVFQSSIGRGYAKRDARGSSQSMVKLGHEHILNWLVPAPPLNEQQEIITRVTSKLDEVNRAREVCSRSIQLLQERRSALISAAVTGKIDVRNYTPKEAV